MEEEDEARTEAGGEPPGHDDDHVIAPGTDVGGYVIEGELGRGGMGVVYSATHPVIGKRVAIKVLRPSLSNNPRTVERFIQEARSVNQIGHPSIVDIFAFGNLPDGRHYLAMDLLDGESLRKRVRRGPLHIREATTVIDEIAAALTAAHAKGFVHRDLKPDNVFLVSVPGRFDVKLLDFGLAKLLPSAGGDRAFRTATGAQLGTPDYMSPEQLRGADDVDHRTDVFALGVMSVEILTGKRPRRFADSTYDLADKSVSEILAAVPFVSSELAQLVERMLAAAPEARPSLPAVRALVKRIRPSLPSLSVVGLEFAIPAADEPSLDSLTASKVGARPVVPTPAAGMPLTRPQPVSQPPFAGLQPSPWLHTQTTVGVPPPPTTPQPRSRPSGSQHAAAPSPPIESRRWLVLAAVLVLAALIALAAVLAT